MSETAVFPLAYDASAEERAAAKREIAKHTPVVGEDAHGIRFVGQAIGQTGPVWHFQYTHLYRLPNGYLAAARDLHEGVKVAFASDPAELADGFENPLVREFLDDELRFRKIIGPAHAAQ